MIKSFRLFFFSFVLISSLILSPVTTVYAVSFPAEINKSFTPDAITSGQISKLRVSIYNPNIFQLTNAHWLDNFPAGITVASPLNITQSCSGTVAAVVGGNSLELTNGIVPPDDGLGTPGSCYVEIDVTSTTPGNLINTIGVGPVNGLSAQGIDGAPPAVDITNTTPASATLNVVGVQPASVGKTFTPNTIWIGQPSVLAITIRNNDLTTTLTQVSLTDTMPANVVLANPAVGATPLNNCGAGVLNAVSGNDFVTLSSASIAPNTTCTISVNVTSSVQGNYLNSIPAGPAGPGSLQSLQGVTSAAVNNIPLAVQATTVTKSFNPTAFQTGETSDLTVTLRNPTFANYTGAQFTDNLPANLTLTGLIVSNSCGGTVTAAAGTTALSLSGGTIPPATAAPFTVGSCSVVVRVTSTVPASPYTNTIPVQTIATGPTTITSPLPATATVTVTARSIGVVKGFAPASFNPGGTSTLTITLQNRTSTPYTGVSFTDIMPAGLTISVLPPTASAACGGPTLTASDANNVVMTNGTIPAGTVATPGTCVITATVTSSTSGAYPNTILAGDVDATTPVGVTNLADSNTATVTVNAPGGPVTGLKNINPNIIAAGANTRLRIDLTAPVDVNLLTFSVTDNLPAGVTISNVNTTGTPTPATKSGNCLGGTLSAVTGTNVISWTGGTLNAGQLCRIEVYVTSTTPGTVTNTISPADITNDKGRTVDAPGLTANLTVTGFSMSKIFNPATVNANGLSTLTITLTNSNSLPLDTVSLSDSLPGGAVNGVRIAPTPNANTTCTGGALPPTVTAVAGAQVISLANGFVPAQALGIPGVCTITVDVQGRGIPTTFPTYQNTIFTSNVIGTLQGTGITQRPIAQAINSLVVGNLTMEVVKKFDPQLVYGGSVSTLSVTLRNPNPAAALTGIAFVDTMPVGMILANPVDFDEGTCGGTLSGTPGTNTFSYSGGSLPANTECKLTLKATLTVNGNLTNTIPIGAVTTFNGVSNTTATSASLTNLAGASISKGFAPNPIIAGSGDYSLLTITIQNTTTLDLTQMGLVDDLPAGLVIAAAPASINNCFGTLDAQAGTQHIQLTNGSLVGNSSCTLLIPVIGATPGVFTNTIPVNTLTTFEGRTNIDPAVATLTLTGFSLGNRVWEDSGTGGGTANDGLRNGTEPSIDGVTVNLYRDSNNDGTPDGAIINTTTTAGGGFYRFDNLSADTYIVEVVTPAGYTSSSVDAGDADADVDDDDDNGVVISGSNIRSNPVTLGPTANEPIAENNPVTNPEAGEAVDNQSNRTVDFGFVTAYSLGNRVWDDNGAGGGTANDGLRNGTEPGIDGITVNLYRDSNNDGTPDGAVIATMNTAGGGFYRFDNLSADTYIVEVVPPTGYTSTVDAGDPDSDVDDDDDNGVVISGSNIRSNPVTLGPGTSEPTAETNPVTNPEAGESADNQSNRTVDFGFVTAYSLGNRVWEDSGVGGGTANDGLRNGTEPGIDGVTVRLFRDSNNDGTPDGAAIATTTTSGGGFYRFDNLSAGTYIVEVVTPSGYTSSSVDAGDPDADVDDDDDNGVVVSGSNIRSNPVTLGPGASEPSGETNPVTNPEAGEAVDNQSNRTVDFGFYFIPYSLGNRVWMDDGTGGGTANDGVRNGTEPGIDGVTVNLYRDSDNNGTPDGAVIDTMNTAGGGFYRFDNLIADTYIVEVVPPAGYTSTVDAGDPDTDVDDDDDNGVVISGSNIRSNPVTLGPGASEPTGENNPAVNPEAGESTDDHSNRTVDFGFVTSYSLGNRVWGDNGAGGGTANDGLRNGTEPGLDGITVRLFRDSNNDGTPDGAAIATTTTAGGGFYRFDNLLADTYIVEVVTPAGYTSSTVDAGDADTDVDDDDDNGVVISGSNIRSNPVTLGPGSAEPIGETNPVTNPEVGESVDNQSNRTVDFGFFFVPYSLGNRVWTDDGTGGGTANDGVRNGTEPGIDGVTVNLYRDSDNNGAPDGAAIATMNTAGGGFYRFDNLIADTYIVEVVPPAGLASTVDAGDPDTDVDDDDDNGVVISGSNIRSNPVTLGPGASEPVAENNPATNPEAGEAADDHSNRTVDFGFVTGYSLGNRVWEDSGAGGGTANDGLRNGTEPGINSVTVRLYRDSNNDGTPDGAAIATTTTSGGGFYRFDNLAADTYIVEVVTPAGYVSTIDAGDPDTDVDDDDDNGVVVSGSNIRSDPVTLGPGASEPTVEDNPLPNPGTGEAADDHSNRTVDFGFIITTTPPPPVSSIQIVKTPSATVVSPGDTVIYSYVVTNTGSTPLSSVLVIDDKCSPVLYVSGDANTNDILETTETWNYTCTTTLSVTTTNIATVTAIGAGNQPVQDTDTATVSIVATGMQKTIIGTSETFTSGNDVAIGEMVTYQITMNLPTGVTLENVVVTDRMDKGLAFVDCISVNLAGTDITSTVCPPTVSAITDPGDTAKNPANPGRQVQFNIGNVTASAAASTLVIQYRAIVLDVIENQETDTLNNSVTLTWTGGSITASAPNVTILEPDLAISKSANPTTVTAGTSIQFTLTITHTALSSTDAFDVVVTDVLPDGLEYIACTPITYSGLPPTTQPDPCNIPGGDTLTFLWDSFPLGQSATIVFFARFDGTKSTVFNSASVSWTSLPIDLGPGGYPIVISIHNDTSTERWYDPEDLINIYQIIDGVWINPPLDGGEEDVILPSGLPSTGFAPNVITTLPEQPAEKSYAATDVWLEIPSLGVNIPIVGVPLVEEDWDVSWLWNQAGWLNGTAFPGWQGNSALTGHVTLPNGKSGPFVGLGSLEWGDKILVHAYGTVYTYEVRQNRTVSPNNTSVLKHEDDAWLTLITCKTYIEETNTYARRIAVRAALISITTEKQTNTSKGGR